MFSRAVAVPRVAATAAAVLPPRASSEMDPCERAGHSACHTVQRPPSCGPALQALAPLAARACGRASGHRSQRAQAPAIYPAAPATFVAQHRYRAHLPVPCLPQVLVPLAVLAQPSATPSPTSSAMAPWAGMGPYMGPAMSPPGPPGQAYQCNGYNSGGGSSSNNNGNDGGSPLQCAPAQQRMLHTPTCASHSCMNADKHEAGRHLPKIQT